MHKVNLAQKLSLFQDHWNPRIVAELNGQEVRVAKFQGEFDWHSHEEADELFLVLAGSMRLELRDESFLLEEGELIVVPAGVEHRPCAVDECHALMFEPASTLNTGNVRSERTRADLERI